MDSSDTLENHQNFQVLAAQPPAVSFRTKRSKSSLKIVSQPSVIEDEFDLSHPEAFEKLERSEGDIQHRSEDSSMSEFYDLRFELLISTLVWTIILFCSTCFFYSFNIALNYLLGAFAGIAYLGLLARNVERLGTSNQVGKSQLALFVGVIFLATQIDGLQVLPVFLGFCTYKVAVLVFTLRAAVLNP